ncbi:hypothetical protein GCM10027589_05190 [Actinocorallia lasiicapitis]
MREIPQITVPPLPLTDLSPKEPTLQVPPATPAKKPSKKSALKRTNQNPATSTRAAAHRNARHLPTRQMNNRGGR